MLALWFEETLVRKKKEVFSDSTTIVFVSSPWRRPWLIHADTVHVQLTTGFLARNLVSTLGKLGIYASNADSWLQISVTTLSATYSITKLLVFYFLKVHQMGTGGFSSWWRLLRSGCDLWTMCAYVLAWRPLQEWSPIPQSVAGICGLLSLWLTFVL